MSLTKVSVPELKEIAKVTNNVCNAVDAIAGTNGLTSLTASTATLIADDSGKTYAFNRAAGVVVTLPAAKVGLRFKFIVGTSVTSNAYKVIAPAATSLFTGVVLLVGGTSGAVAGFVPGASDYAITMNGSTLGGLLGTQFELVCVSATQWIITGVVAGSGTLATPFAAS
jgi:hypothetical protein